MHGVFHGEGMNNPHETHAMMTSPHQNVPLENRKYRLIDSVLLLLKGQRRVQSKIYHRKALILRRC